MVDIVARNGEAAESDAKSQCYDSSQLGRCVSQDDEEKRFHPKATAIEHFSEKHSFFIHFFQFIGQEQKFT